MSWILLQKYSLLFILSCLAEAHFVRIENTISNANVYTKSSNEEYYKNQEIKEEMQAPDDISYPINPLKSKVIDPHWSYSYRSIYPYIKKTFSKELVDQLSEDASEYQNAPLVPQSIETDISSSDSEFDNLNLLELVQFFLNTGSKESLLDISPGEEDLNEIYFHKELIESEKSDNPKFAYSEDGQLNSVNPFLKVHTNLDDTYDWLDSEDTLDRIPSLEGNLNEKTCDSGHSQTKNVETNPKNYLDKEEIKAQIANSGKIKSYQSLINHMSREMYLATRRIRRSLSTDRVKVKALNPDQEYLLPYSQFKRGSLMKRIEVPIYEAIGKVYEIEKPLPNIFSFVTYANFSSQQCDIRWKDPKTQFCSRAGKEDIYFSYYFKVSVMNNIYQLTTIDVILL